MKSSLVLESGVLAALCLAFGYSTPTQLLILGPTVFCVFLGFELLLRPWRQFLVPVFQVLYSLVCIATLFEIVRLTCPIAFEIEAPLAVLAIFLLSISSARLMDRIGSAAIFLLFVLLLVAVEALGCTLKAFSPGVFFVVAFGIVGISSLYAWAGRRWSR